MNFTPIGLLPNFLRMKPDENQLKIIQARSKEEYRQAGLLFKKYAEELGLDLSFQGFETELQNIQKQYGPPQGGLLLIKTPDDRFIGCAGVRKLEGPIGELKRMYINKEGRGQGLGGRLLKKSIELARTLSYQKLRLDTLPSMKSAIGLYEKEGFYLIEAYRFNPIDGTKFYQKDL